MNGNVALLRRTMASFTGGDLAGKDISWRLRRGSVKRLRIIEGVATSITAFFVRQPRGPSNIPWIVSSYFEFENGFGRLGDSNTIVYAVGDFFANGGNHAYSIGVMARTDAQRGAGENSRQYSANFSKSLGLRENCHEDIDIRQHLRRAVSGNRQ